MTTEPNIEDIRAREAAATPGPLDIDIRGRLTGIRARDGRDLVVMYVQGDDVEAGFRSRPDAVFFAHARTDIPALLALVESQAARVAELEAEVRRLRGERDTLRRALLDLMASSDCEWEERNLGHDWREAMEHAREVLGIHPGGL